MTPPSPYRDHCNCVEDILSEFNDPKVCIIGDYNLPSVNWHHDSSDVLSPVALRHNANVATSMGTVAEYSNLYNLKTTQ